MPASTPSKYKYLLLNDSETPFLEKFQQRNSHIKLFLDSNICLDIVSYVENRQNDKKKREQIQDLLLFIYESECEVYFAGPIYELCMDKDSLQINKEKAIDFADKIWEGIHLSPDDIFSTYKCQNIRLPYTEIIGSLEPIAPMLHAFYAAFLKLMLISRKELSKSSALRNLKEYLDFLHNDLDLFSAYIIQPALAILGGGTGERKFLGIDKKNGDFCRRAWGAACDAWLYFIPHYKSTERPTILKQDLVFVTNDSALFEIYRKINAKYVIHTGGKRQYENEFDLDYPNFREQIGIVGALFDAYDRTDRRLKAPKTNYKPIIEELTNKLE